MSVAWLNGALLDEASAAVSILDRGFTLGDGLFETMRVYGGRVFRLRQHIARLEHAAERIALPLPGELDNAVRETVAASGLADAAVRLTATRGSGFGLTPPDRAEPTIAIHVRPYVADSRRYEHGVRAMTARTRLHEGAATAGLKHLGRLDLVVAQADARLSGAEEALFLDVEGHLAEGAASNLFLARAGVLYTPPLTCGVLPGITRQVVLELAAASSVPTHADAPLGPEALRDADEAFLTSSLRELVPLVAVDERPIGNERPGPMTRTLLARYRKQACPDRPNQRHGATPVTEPTQASEAAE